MAHFKVKELQVSAQPLSALPVRRVAPRWRVHLKVRFALISVRFKYSPAETFGLRNWAYERKQAHFPYNLKT